VEDGKIRVECYSGHRYAQEPRAVIWQGQRYEIELVERAWRTPTGPVFRVRTADGRCFELAYDETADRWAMI
jgi:hypothetical protein